MFLLYRLMPEWQISGKDVSSTYRTVRLDIE